MRSGIQSSPHIFILFFYADFSFAAESLCRKLCKPLYQFNASLHSVLSKIAENKIDARRFNIRLDFHQTEKSFVAVRRFGAFGDGQTFCKPSRNRRRVDQSVFTRVACVRRFSSKHDFRAAGVKALGFKFADMSAVNRICKFRRQKMERHFIHSVSRLFIRRKDDFNCAVF